MKLRKKIVSIFIILAMMLSLGACANSEKSQGLSENLTDTIAMNTEFVVDIFTASVTSVYVNPLEISPTPEKKIVTIEIDYSPLGKMKSSQLNLHSMDTTKHTFHSLDGLDYLGSAHTTGIPFIRFLVDNDENEFVLYFDINGSVKKIHVVIGEKGGETIPPENLYKGHFKDMKYSKNLYAIRKKDMTDEEFAVAISLQGIVAQTEASIVIDIDNYMEYIDALKKADTSVTVTYATNVWELVKHFIVNIKDSSYVIYDFVKGDAGVNMAAVIASGDSYLGVPRELAEKAKLNGLNLKRDLGAIKGSQVERQRVIFSEYKNKLNKFALVHQITTVSNYPMHLRDIGIALNCFTFFTEQDEEGRAFRREVLAWADSNIPVMGWTTDEIGFVSDISSYGDFVLPMDWANNQSILMAIKQEKITQKNHDKAITSKNGMHYVALVVSDGDNLQWVQRDFSNSSHFGQRQKANKDYKITWTFPPYLSELNPFGAQLIYNKACENDYFISGVSGVGYMNCLSYPQKYLDKFTELTAEAMKTTDLNVVTLLDNKNKITSDAMAKERIEYYAKHNQIKGGIWELDPDRYEAGKGKIYYSSTGKPFVSVRLSLWHPSNNASNVTTEWLTEQANKVNSYPTDITKESAYSVVNVHPWTISISSLEQFVSKLNSNIELVSAGELIDLIANNIK